MFSPDAQRLLVVGGDAVAVLDAASRAEQQRLTIPAVMAAALSPKGTFLITFQRPSKDESGQGELVQVLDRRAGPAAGGASGRRCACSNRLPPWCVLSCAPAVLRVHPAQLSMTPAFRARPPHVCS